MFRPRDVGDHPAFLLLSASLISQTRLADDFLDYPYRTWPYKEGKGGQELFTVYHGHDEGVARFAGRLVCSSGTQSFGLLRLSRLTGWIRGFLHLTASRGCA